MRIAVVTGNPKPASRTHGVALAVARALAEALRAPYGPDGALAGALWAPGGPGAPVLADPVLADPVLADAVLADPVLADAALADGVPGAHLEVDLAGYAQRLFDPADGELSRLTAEVAAADVAIFASPTYKASYTGMLKAFLDRYGNNGLAGTVAVPVMTGGWAGHLLAVEVHLRPVLVELGATVPARGLYVTEPELAELDAKVAGWAATAVPLIGAALAAHEASEV
jgi:FMN reductase